MKIKDIISNKWNFNVRVLVARRLMRCSNVMKREIVNWRRTGIVTDRKLSLMINDRECMTVSVHELMDVYGMDPLTAMLFFDDLIKANNLEDKTQLVNLIERLQNGLRKKSLKMTPDMLAQIKNNQPELWKEYESLQHAAPASTPESGEELGEAELAE